MDKYKFTEVQAQAILDMQLRKLAALERLKIENDYKDTKERIEEYNRILENEDEILKVISMDLTRIKENTGMREEQKL
jgi:DNA gyrase subunit A